MALKTTGLDRFLAGLDGAIDRGVYRSATMIADLAVQLAPEDSGDLKRSGHVEPATLDGSGVAHVVFDMPYAGYVEHGTSNPNYPAQPYLGPAAAAIDVQQEIAQELRALAARSRV